MKKIRQFIKNFLTYVVVQISRFARLDLQMISYKEMGILRSGEYEDSGETMFLEKILPFLINNAKPVFFDIGANIGRYSSFLRELFPLASIYSFEPSPITYKKLEQNTLNKKIKTFLLGLSSSKNESEIYSDPEDPTNGYTSLHGKNLNEINRLERPLQSIGKIKLTTLDSFCSENKVNFIDFMKIDIEGHELEALKGGIEMIKSSKIGVIQFEFNVTNIASRSFLRDFYDLLQNYSFYRLKPNGIIPLGSYNGINEIFRIHNLVAISNKVHHESDFLKKVSGNKLLFDRYGRHIKVK